MRIIIALIVLGSFFLFSLAFNSNLTSDDALNVLMADTYHLPHDIYCWGQDRGGTLIPLLAQPLIKLFGLSALLSVSISNYFILFLGFLGFSKLFKNNLTILLFALLWFLPFERFVNLNSFPIGMSYSLIGFSIIFIQKLYQSQKTSSWYVHYLNLFICISLWGLAAWVSDLALITILILIISLLINYYLRKPADFPIRKFYISIGIGIPFIVVLIKIAKTFATGVTSNYSKFNSFQEFLSALRMVFSDCVNVLSFHSKEVFVSIGAWFLVFLLIYLIVAIIQNRRSILSFENVWINVFLIDILVILSVIFVSHWVLLNNMGRWYFVSTYISFLMLFLLFLDSKVGLKERNNKALALGFVVIISLSSVLTPFLKLKENYRPLSTTIGELNKLGKIGIIANYWDAYRCSMVNPSQIKSTPNEGGDLKNQERIVEVFNQPRIFISRDMWFDEFPDSISQFGIMLYKHKKELLLGGSNLCQYTIKPLRRIYDLNMLKYDPSTFDRTQNCLIAKKENTSLINKHLVFGPDVSLVKGKYRIKYYCTSESKSSTNSLPVSVDISSDYGQKSVFFKDIPQNELKNDRGYIEVFLTVESFLQHVEFRLLYKGMEDIRFSRIEVVQVK